MSLTTQNSFLNASSSTTAANSAKADLQNCSTYNPCDNNGYCVDINNQSNSTWQCVCRFWWEGKTCQSMSLTGQEVIATSVITAALILSYHILEIVLRIYKKKKEESTDSTKSEVDCPVKNEMEESFIDDNKRRCSCSTLITIPLMMIITTAALIIRWAILKPIHDEIVDKYNRKVPIYYVQNSFCSYISDQNLNIITFPVACVLIVAFIIVSKRISFQRDLCRGYVAPIIPLNFFAHIHRTYFAVVFATLCNHALNIITLAFEQERARRNGSIIQYAKNLGLVLVICVCYYPMLAAAYINTIFTLACASLYIWLYFTIAVIYQGYCPKFYYTSEKTYQETNSSADTIKYLSYYGTGPDLIAIELCIDIPRYLCLSYISIRLPVMFIRKIRQCLSNKRENEFKHTREEHPFFVALRPYSVETLYVKNLFRSPNTPPPSRSIMARLIPKSIYEWRDDFRFSSRIVCIYAMVFLALYVITIRFTTQEIPDMLVWKGTMQAISSGKIASMINNQATPSQNQTPIDTSVTEVKIPFILAVLTALIITFIQALVLLASIRRNLLQKFRGNHSEIPKREDSNNLQYSIGNLHFGGFFIGYVVWGYILCFYLSFLIYYYIGKLFEKNGKLAESVLKLLLPIILLSIFKVYVNMFIAKYVLLPQNNNVLAINNHRYTMIILYFNFFLDTFLGLAASFTRFLNTIVMTIVYTSRLDYSPLGRQLEYRDAGFSAYIGFIHMESVQRNPTMLLFVSMLLVDYRTKRCQPSSRARQKWHLAVLLVRNPSLMIARKKILARQRKDSALAMVIAGSDPEHLSGTQFDGVVKAVLRSEYSSHGYRPSNNLDTVQSVDKNEFSYFF